MLHVERATLIIRNHAGSSPFLTSPIAFFSRSRDRTRQAADIKFILVIHIIPPKGGSGF